MKNLKIGLDVDDVLAGFYPAMCERYGKSVDVVDIWDGKKDCKWLKKAFPEVVDDFDFWRTLPVITRPESINFSFDCYISAFPEQMYDARIIWLMNNGFPCKPLICSDDKLSICKEYGINVLIDDKKDTIDQVKECSILGIRYRPYYMIEDGQDIDHINQVPEVIKNFA